MANKLMGVKEFEALKKRDKEYTVSAGDGLSIRILPSGAKTFQYRYKMPDDKYAKRLRLGSFPEMTLAKARKSLSEYRAMVKSGSDPVEEKQEIIAKRRSEPTVTEAYEDYKNKYLFGHDKNGNPNLKAPGKQVEYFDRDVLPKIGSWKITQVKGRHLVDILDNITNRGSYVSANRTLSAMKTFFSWCVGRKLISIDPSDGIKKKHVGGKEVSRKSYLSADELKVFWKKVDNIPSSRQIILVIKILLLTGQRVSELVNATWDHIDFENHLWTVPVELSKNAEPNNVPLHDDTIRYFQELKMLAGQSRYVCQSPQVTDKEKPLLYWSVDKAVRRMFEEQYNKAGNRIDWKDEITKFTIHDFRRTLSTHLGDVGIPPYVCEKILNHKMTGMMAVYNSAKYLNEKSDALLQWQEMNRQFKSQIDNVIPILKTERA